MSDNFTGQLSDYIDDELSPADRTALEAHLATCRECVSTLDELRSVVARAATLPARPPARDLWAGIEPRLSRNTLEGHVTPFRARTSRRISFTLPQLAAAGIALMVMSGGGVWVLQHGGRATSMPPVVATNEVVPASLADPRYDEAIADLEQALNAGRADLDPATIKVLETNLAAIDTAISESRQALAADPANVYLNNHLADERQRKLALLRRAAALVGGKT
ncbi:MAG TPA: zf-HC2 domain-containing protein [Vicinamibacterales bacterium]|nr:zf-HC2 domain-containing protein [Vicinamibacterales bacterium]